MALHIFIAQLCKSFDTDIMLSLAIEVCEDLWDRRRHTNGLITLLLLLLLQSIVCNRKKNGKNRSFVVNKRNFRIAQVNFYGKERRNKRSPIFVCIRRNCRRLYLGNFGRPVPAATNYHYAHLEKLPNNGSLVILLFSFLLPMPITVI